MNRYPLITLRQIARNPVDVRDIQPLAFYRLARHRAIDVKNGMATITRTGLRQLRNTP